MFTLWRTKWIHVLSQQSNSPWLGLIYWRGPECGFLTCTDGCSVGVDVYTRSPRSALTATLSEQGVSAKISANSHDEPFHLDYNQPPSQYLLPQQQAHPEHLGRKFMGKNLRCSVWRQTHNFMAIGKQEAHGPHSSPEKTVQINKNIWLYHNFD